MAEFASKGVAGAGLGLGIAGTALGVLGTNVLPGLFGMGRNAGCGGCTGMATPMVVHNECSENHTVNRYELAQESKIADLQSQIALRDANVYNDQKLLEVYKYFDGKIENINGRLCDQAVWNATQTATIGCMAQQIAALNGLTKLVVPNTSVCPGWGNVTITPATTPTTAG